MLVLDPKESHLIKELNLEVFEESKTDPLPVHEDTPSRDKYISLFFQEFIYEVRIYPRGFGHSQMQGEAHQVQRLMQPTPWIR